MIAKHVAPLALGLLGIACGGKSTPLPTNVGVAALGAPVPLPSAAVTVRKETAPTGVDAHALQGVPDGSIGPFLARRGDVVMAAYIGVSSGGARRVVSVPLAANGDTRGDARVVAPISTDATMLVLRATGGAKPGFVAAWTSLTDRGEALSLVGIMDDGRSRGDAIELARTPDDIVWVDVVPTSRGAVAMWAEQTHSGDANILAASLAPDGAMRGLPAKVARGVTGWQAVATTDGAGLALVTPAAASANAKRGAKKASVVSWLRIDADARASAPQVVASNVRLAGDLDAVRVGDQTLLAWTDASQSDPQPVLTTVDGASHVTGPTRAIAGGAGGTLAGLASGPAGAVVAWEEPFRRGRASKRITIARVDVAKTAIDASAEASLDVQGRGAPELAGLSDGFALLAPARVCTENEACDDAPVLPAFVRFDARLAVAQVEPLRLGILRDVATAGWSLACDPAKTCLALATAPSSDGGGSRVLAADFRPRTTTYRTPGASPSSPGAPTVASLDTIATGEPFTDLAAARFGDGAIVALLAASNDETAKRDDMGTIAARVFDANGAPAGDAAITKRALAVGGVAIAATDRPEDGAAIAWVARDAGDPQVHVARVDRRGKLLHDEQLTSAKGEATDVTIAWSGDRWIVAWVDTRDGNGEVYATTLDRDGRVVGHGQRITNAPGDASDVALLALPDAVGPDGRGAVWLAWADPRESPQDGFADIYVAQLRSKDAAREGDETRVLATAAHSRSPSLGARGKDVALGWIEEAPLGADPGHARAYGAMLAWLDPTGHASAEPARLPVAGDGFPTAIALDGSRERLRAVLARAAPDLIVLDALDLPRDGKWAPFPLLTLDGPPSLDVALGVVGDSLFFNDESADADARRVRRATVRWKK